MVGAVLLRRQPDVHGGADDSWLSETMDHGYPQITAVNLLTSYIKVGNVKEDISRVCVHAFPIRIVALNGVRVCL